MTSKEYEALPINGQHHLEIAGGMNMEERKGVVGDQLVIAWRQLIGDPYMPIFHKEVAASFNGDEEMLAACRRRLREAVEKYFEGRTQ